MGRNLDDIIKNFPAKRQAKIATLSKQKIEEMIAHAATLSDFRKAVGKTQVEVAQELGINQNAVSQLEKRSDTYISTLRRFLKSLGLTLEFRLLTRAERVSTCLIFCLGKMWIPRQIIPKPTPLAAAHLTEKQRQLLFEKLVQKQFLLKE